MHPLKIIETHINGETGDMISQTEPKEIEGKLGDIFQVCMKKYGRASSFHHPNGKGKKNQAGWTFYKFQYDEFGKRYRHEVWVEVFYNDGTPFDFTTVRH